jgi:hypothetical protein
LSESIQNCILFTDASLFSLLWSVKRYFYIKNMTLFFTNAPNVTTLFKQWIYKLFFAPTLSNHTKCRTFFSLFPPHPVPLLWSSILSASSECFLLPPISYLNQRHSSEGVRKSDVKLFCLVDGDISFYRTVIIQVAYISIFIFPKTWHHHEMQILLTISTN